MPIRWLLPALGIGLNGRPGNADAGSAILADVLKLSCRCRPAADFNYIHNDNGELIAIFSRPDHHYDSNGLNPYLDLSPYYLEFGNERDFLERYQTDQQIINTHKTASTFDPILYNYCQFQLSTANRQVRHWRVNELQFPGFLQDTRPAPTGGMRTASVPLFPSIYPPRRYFHFDLHYMRAIVERLDFKASSKVLVVGPGSGTDSWIVSQALGALTDRPKIHVAGINPIEVANVSATAAITGFEVEARVSDNIISEDGQPVFPGQKFDFVLWNMPAVLIAGPVQMRFNGLERFWDSDVNGNTLRRFAYGLPQLLTDNGVALVWNKPINVSAKNGKGDLVADVIQSAGTFNSRTGDPYEKIFDVERINISAIGEACSAVYLARRPT